MKKLFIITMIFVILFQMSIVTTSATSDIVDSSFDSKNYVIEDVLNYKTYFSKVSNISFADESIVLTADCLSSYSEDTEFYQGYEGKDGTSMLSTSDGFLEWEIDVPESALYQLSFSYYNIQSKGVDIERQLMIDDAYPFSECKNVVLYRYWKEESKVGNIDNRDINGNDILPKIVEYSTWGDLEFKDATGLNVDAYSFYLEKGLHKIKLVGINEPVIIHSLTFKSPEKIISYEELKESNKDYENILDVSEPIVIEAEDMFYRNDASMFPSRDSTSSLTTPYDAVKIRYNCVGGENWQSPQQEIVWSFSVPEDGLYSITLRAKQSFQSGISSARKIKIDGKVPCTELEAYEFPYSVKWQMETLKSLNDENIKIFLSKGTHTLSMTVTLGEVSNILSDLQDLQKELTDIYRKIIQIVSVNPDLYRNYKLETALPAEVEYLGIAAKKIDDMEKTFQGLANGKNSNTSTLKMLSRQLKEFNEAPRIITKNLSSFQSNLGSLATWITNYAERPLQLDKIIIHDQNAQLPKSEEGLFSKILNGIKKFLGTFVTDYASIGAVSKDAKSIEVWVQAGRDQAETIRSLVENTYKSSDGTVVNLKLVSGQLLMATISGRGPDVALQCGVSDPMNYAARGACMNLSEFDDFLDIKSRFRDSAMVPFYYNDGYYALPETQTFQMMFYRADIFKELGYDIPKTWDDAISLMCDLQKKNLQFGIPTDIFKVFLYQNNSKYFNEEGTATALNEENSIQAFEFYTDLYKKYGAPLSYDAANRFRTGEMPILITDFSFYNTISVFAPEIRGEWSFCPVPGTKNDENNINGTVCGTGLSCMILSASKLPTESWEFLKWWTSADTQKAYGTSIENRLGVAARYSTANIEAFANLPWPTADYEQLNKQWESVEGIPEIPGGYYLDRYFQIAFRRVINNNEYPRDALLDVCDDINEEINRKRTEFGLN